MLANMQDEASEIEAIGGWIPVDLSAQLNSEAHITPHGVPVLDELGSFRW